MYILNMRMERKSTIVRVRFVDASHRYFCYNNRKDTIIHTVLAKEVLMVINSYIEIISDYLTIIVESLPK